LYGKNIHVVLVRRGSLWLGHDANSLESNKRLSGNLSLLSEDATTAYFSIPRFLTGIVEVVKFFAGGSYKRSLGWVESTLRLVMADEVERVPILAFFDAFDVFIDIRSFFKQTLLIKIVPLLAVIDCQGDILRRLAAGDGEVTLVICFSQVEAYLFCFNVSCQ
jgi:hypothetical protein